uniref:Uncharacterized protein n=1 Tax=Anguilla anguilla TaxID=7936 RepID=A0A0E9RC63_ANGAN
MRQRNFVYITQMYCISCVTNLNYFKAWFSIC